ncbi:hypothetical protein J3D49_000930 [Pseudomonas kilonensis]|nr:hypothetical protein [Pseudomonas kilonensis]
MHPVTLCVTFQKRNAERPWRHSHAGAWERSTCISSLKNHMVAICSMRACSRWAAKQPPTLPEKCLQTKPHHPLQTLTANPSSPNLRAKISPVYSAGVILPSSYTSLRHCLQLRQNPPACAPCPWALLSSCHCPSVVGFSSSVSHLRLHECHPVRRLPALDGGCAQGACGRAGFGDFTGLLTCAQLPPFV